MNDAAPSKIIIPDIIGTPTEHGILFGRIRAADLLFALFQPSAEISRRHAARWSRSLDRVADAYSFSDGYANTLAMAKAGSEIAQYALDHGLHIPSLDESDLQYRLFKPTAAENDCWMRAGINLSTEPPLHPYTPEFPKQTELEAFRAGGPEAFAEEWHWTLTQYRASSNFAWVQHFGDGGQDDYRKAYEFPVRLVRRLPIR